MSDNRCTAVPLTERLRSVPPDAVLRIDTPNALGCADTRSIPVGRFCHEAAASIEAYARRLSGASAEDALRRVIQSTHSHVDGRDLLAELHPRHTLDIKRRVDGVETWYEADWLSNLWGAIKGARRVLAGQPFELPPAPARSMSSAEQQRPDGERAQGMPL